MKVMVVLSFLISEHFHLWKIGKNQTSQNYFCICVHYQKYTVWKTCNDFLNLYIYPMHPTLKIVNVKKAVIMPLSYCRIEVKLSVMWPNLLCNCNKMTFDSHAFIVWYLIFKLVTYIMCGETCLNWTSLEPIFVFRIDRSSVYITLGL